MNERLTGNTESRSAHRYHQHIKIVFLENSINPSPGGHINILLHSLVVAVIEAGCGG
jgi:hypothetical protein